MQNSPLPCFITRGVNSCEHGTNIPLAWILIVPKNNVNFGECNGSHRIQDHRGCMNSYLWNLWFFRGLLNGSMIVNEHPKLPGVWPVAVCGILYPNINSTAAAAPRFPRAPPICGCSLAKNFHQKCRNPQDLYGNLVQNGLFPRNEWKEIHCSFQQKKANIPLAKATLRCSQPWSPGRGTSAPVPLWNGQFCSIDPLKYGWMHQAKWKHPRLPAEIEQKRTKESMAISGSDSLEVPSIYKAYCSGLCKGISQQNMALYGTVPPF